MFSKELQSVDEILGITHPFYHCSLTVQQLVDAVTRININQPSYSTYTYIPARLANDVFSYFVAFANKFTEYQFECYYDSQYDIFVIRNIKLNGGVSYINEDGSIYHKFKGGDRKENNHCQNWTKIPQNAIVFIYSDDNNMLDQLLNELSSLCFCNKVIMFDLTD